MSLVLHYHPLSSCCQKVLIALYETGAPVTLRHLDLGDAAARQAHCARWPLGKMPLLEDEATGWVLPETSIIIEYLDRTHPGPQPLLPVDPAQCLDTRLWDRLCDLYLMQPMQRAVAAKLSGDAERAAGTAAEVAAHLDTAYGLVEHRLAGRAWLAGDDFSLADCAAMPALFYAAAVRPFAQSHPALGAYFRRLRARAAVARVLDEARPWLTYFPLFDTLPPSHREALEA